MAAAAASFQGAFISWKKKQNLFDSFRMSRARRATRNNTKSENHLCNKEHIKTHFGEKQLVVLAINLISSSPQLIC